jgi:hypothetical protein
MSIRKLLILLWACVLAGPAAPFLPAAPAAGPAPATTGPALAAPLLPGEGLAMAGPDGTVYVFGEAAREAPMGSLAKLVWLKLEGADWGAMGVQFTCTGEWQGVHCWLPKGHGKVDLAKATQENCDLAYLAWARMSAQIWLKDYGEGAARARLEDAFGPFLGSRIPPGDGLPPISPAWVGDGDLLRTSPEAMVRWLMDPDQDQAVRLVRRLLLSFKQFNYQNDAWWIETGTAPVPGAAGATTAWAAGGNGKVLAVLHLPRGKGKADGLERFRAILNLPAGK